MRLTEQDVLEKIEQDESAYGLLHAADPNFERRFNRLCRTMKELLADVQKHFPDAQYYTASGGFNLMLGSPHANNRALTNQSELVALSGIGVQIGDGDF